MYRSTRLTDAGAGLGLGLLLMALGGMPAQAADAGGAPAAADAAPRDGLWLWGDGGSDPLRLAAADLSADALRQAIASGPGANQVLVLRAASAEPTAAPALLLASGAGVAEPVSLAVLAQWLSGSAAQRLVVVMALEAPSTETGCGPAVMDGLSQVKTNLVLLCRAEAEPQSDARSPTGLFDAAISVIAEQQSDGADAGVTAFGLPAALAARLDSGPPLSARLQGHDWPLTPAAAETVAADPEAKVDPALWALAAPGLASADLDAALADLEQAGVDVRRDEPAAVSVRMIAPSAEAAARLRTEVEQAGGQISVLFDNTLFAVLPLAALRPLAESADTWMIQANRRTVHPMSR